MTAKIIDQKEYLKKYLSGKDKDKKKKKKRRPKILGEGLKIIDDDIDLSQLDTLEENEIDLFHLNEDAPQIVGIVDERAPEIKTLDDYRSSSKWKSIENREECVNELDDKTNGDLNVLKKPEYDSDASPPRNNARDESPLRRNKTDKRNAKDRADDSDASPPRRRAERYSGSDNSPPRARNIKNNNNREDSDNSPARQRGSPPRRRFSSDNSPPRKSGYTEISRRNSRDLSPPRRRNDNPTRNTNNRRDNSPRRGTNFADDRSRDRRVDREYSSRPLNSRVRSRSRSPRFNTRNSYSKNIGRGRSPDSRRNLSRRPEVRNTRDDSPDRNQRFEKRRSPESNAESAQKMSKTLDGKTAGLQNAKSLKVEAESFRRKENNVFEAMNAEQSGRGAQTVVRDRKTGRRRDFDKEREEDSEKQERNKERKEKYSRWGKGLKQVEEREARLHADAHEMTKPLARYADDRDLEQHLRSQIHSGDPMLEYMQRKDLENKVKKGIEVKPLYQGSYPPNRFDIRPGYRWDGVDRSTGYEKKYFEAINSRKAKEEEAYKWSTEDM